MHNHLRELVKDRLRISKYTVNDKYYSIAFAIHTRLVGGFAQELLFRIQFFKQILSTYKLFQATFRSISSNLTATLLDTPGSCIVIP